MTPTLQRLLRLRHGRCELLEQISWQGISQLPGHGHGRLGCVFHVRGRAEKPECAIICSQATKEHHRTAHLLVILIPSAGLAVLPGHGLALPMDERPADRVVAISRLWRKLAAGLIKRERKQVGRRIFRPIHTALPGTDPGCRTYTERGQNLNPRVARVYTKRHIWMRRQIMLEMVDPGIKNVQQVEELSTHLGMRPQLTTRVLECFSGRHNRVGDRSNHHSQESAFFFWQGLHDWQSIRAQEPTV